MWMTQQVDLVARATDGRVVALTHLHRPAPHTAATDMRALERDDAVSVIPTPDDRAVVTAEEAFDHLGIDRSTGYKAIRDGTFPVPVIRVGRLIRVPTAPLRRALHLEATTPPAPGDDAHTAQVDGMDDA
jgi:predicted DNA-binding transcriptional regulator AlpA